MKGAYVMIDYSGEKLELLFRVKECEPIMGKCMLSQGSAPYTDFWPNIQRFALGIKCWCCFLVSLWDARGLDDVDSSGEANVSSHDQSDFLNHTLESEVNPGSLVWHLCTLYSCHPPSTNSCTFLPSLVHNRAGRCWTFLDIICNVCS